MFSFKSCPGVSPTKPGRYQHTQSSCDNRISIQLRTAGLTFRSSTDAYRCLTRQQKKKELSCETGSHIAGSKAGRESFNRENGILASVRERRDARNREKMLLSTCAEPLLQ